MGNVNNPGLHRGQSKVDPYFENQSSTSTTVVTTVNGSSGTLTPCQNVEAQIKNLQTVITNLRSQSCPVAVVDPPPKTTAA